VVVASA